MQRGVGVWSVGQRRRVDGGLSLDRRADVGTIVHFDSIITARLPT
jgi:hypothetical protein